MYAQLTVIATFDRDVLKDRLIRQIGVNRVNPEVVLRGTVFEHDRTIISRIIAAEVIKSSASLIYFFQGSDTVSVHITAATVGQLKEQAVRVTRQMRSLVSKWKRFSASVSVLTQERQGSDELIIAGEYLPKLRRIANAAADKWAGKLLPPATTFLLTLYFLNTIRAAAIALAAAVVSFGAEAFSAVRSAEDWKWKDAT